MLWTLSTIAILTLVQKAHGQSLGSGTPELRKVLSLDAKTRCKALYRNFGVVPGESWGTMDEEQQQEWLGLECDLVYCKRDRRMGRGIYKCQRMNRMT
jgi:hypothetical protein